MDQKRKQRPYGFVVYPNEYCAPPPNRYHSTQDYFCQSVISCPVNDLLYEPSPRPRSLPSPMHGRGERARAGYRNCLYGHYISPILVKIEQTRADTRYSISVAICQAKIVEIDKL